MRDARRQQRSAGARAAALALALAATVGALAPVAEVGAAPAAPAAPVGVPPAPPAALPARPTNDRYARQIVAAVVDPGDAIPDPMVLEVGADLDEGTPRTTAVRTAVLEDLWLEPRIAEDYAAVFGRQPDPSGLVYWLRKVRSGTSLEQVVLNHTTSTEAWRRAGQTNGGFVDLAYDAVLGSPPDPAGRAYWVRKLDAGATRSSLVRGLLRSNQRATRLVVAAYPRYLGRAADPTGRAAKIDQYRRAAIDEIGLIVGLLGSAEAQRSGCDPLDPRLCLLPFPNDRFTVPDASTATGRRVSLKREWMPKNVDGVQVDPQEWNRNDGFSVGQAALLKVPNLDLAQTGAAPLDDIGASLDAEAPILVIDAETGERHPVFTELDANIPAAQQAADQLLSIRPARNYEAGHRYIVVLRDLKRADGSAIAAPAAFSQLLTDDGSGFVGDTYQRWVDQQFLLSELAVAGIGFDGLYLAWDFTVASVENTTGRMLHIRDDALASLEGAAPTFDVTSVVAAPRAGVDRRIEGTFEVPLYLTGDSSPGQGFATGPDGLPQRNGTYTARFGCELPTLPEGETARSVVYGHGLFGDFGEVRSGPQAAMVRDHDMAYCATDWIGMSETDIGNAATILKDLSTFNTLPDRSQQGILNTIFLGRLMVTADGFVSDPAFQTAGGGPSLDTSALFYDGNSQGGVIGGAYVAVSPDVQAGVLGVFGMNYSTLLERSVDFDPFSQIQKLTYPSAAERVVGLQLIQMLWDRGETNGYAAHLTDDPLPGSGANRVLLHTALGDHQVATFTAEITARTAGMAIHRPVYLLGRTTDVEEAWGIPALTYPSTGSGLIVWDSGAALAPLTNIPPRTGDDPHQDPRNSAVAQAQKSAFLAVDGVITDACGAVPCTAPAT